MFNHGVLSLKRGAPAPRISIFPPVAGCARLQSGTRAPRDPGRVERKACGQAFLQLLLFQSMPDHWAIDQVFPILPLSRLDEEPAQRAVLQDITCDSDGRVDLYVDGEGVETSLPLHAPKQGEPYLLGIFMVGAYQEILGDMHNLFGDTDSVHVELMPNGKYELVQPRRGRHRGFGVALRELRTAGTDRRLPRQGRRRAGTSLSAKTARPILPKLNAGLKGYTYLED